MSQDFVILLHGLARSARSMRVMKLALERAGFGVINCDYPSTQHCIEFLANEAIEDALSHCPDTAKIHFVTHSMGGILVRQYLSERIIENLGRVVMLAPPNKGSEVVDRLSGVPGYAWFNGPAGKQLGTGKSSVPNSLKGCDFELGVIAGARSINVFLSMMLPKPDDGKVSVENTKLDGMTDHRVMPVAHPFIMKNKGVIYQTIQFLKQGIFD
jgi:pimeloyl-ACP methyl ester carboxylesterase